MSDTTRAPRRIVLLEGDDSSAVRTVLQEYPSEAVDGCRLHEDVQRLAGEHPGQTISAEWLGPLGWTRFLWCRR